MPFLAHPRLYSDWFGYVNVSIPQLWQIGPICRDLDSSDPEHRLSSLEDSNRVSQLWGRVSNLDLFGSNLVIWDILVGEAPVLLTYCECLWIASRGTQSLWTLLKLAGLFRAALKGSHKIGIGGLFCLSFGYSPSWPSTQGLIRHSNTFKSQKLPALSGNHHFYRQYLLKLWLWARQCCRRYKVVIRQIPLPWRNLHFS